MCSKKYARKNSATGKGMNSGYIFNHGDYYCETEEEAKNYVESLDLNWIEELATVDTNEEWFFYTEWEEIEEDDNWYDKDGNQFTKCYLCKEVTLVLEDFRFCQHCLTHL